MAKWQYKKGLQDLGNGSWAYLLPDGSWGWSNAGLISDSGASLLVDTLFDLKLTGEMLDTMRRGVPAARRIETLVNTHANGDHTFGNQLVSGARIVSTESVSEGIAFEDAAYVMKLMDEAKDLGEGGRFMREAFGHFDFRGIVPTPPTETFVGALTLEVGGKRVELVDVGPAHTASDVLVHVPSDRTVFTGDILFVNGHPTIWAGPVRNWIRACELILEWDVETIVPGHGPICDKQGVRAFRDYLVYIDVEARKRFDAGMPFDEAAYDIALGQFDHWIDAERMVVNVHALYGEYAGKRPEAGFHDLWEKMARYRQLRAPWHAHEHGAR